MTYLADWKTCKDLFEKKAGKKPSEKFLGVFRKSSGMEDGANGLDTALQKLDPKEIDKAREKYIKAKHAYKLVLEQAYKEKTDVKDLTKMLTERDKAEYKAALDELAAGMDEILIAFNHAIDKHLTLKERSLADIKAICAKMQKESEEATDATHQAEDSFKKCEDVVRKLVSASVPIQPALTKQLTDFLNSTGKSISTKADRVAKIYDSVSNDCKSIAALGKSQKELHLAQTEFDSLRDQAKKIQDSVRDKSAGLQKLVAKSTKLAKQAEDASKINITGAMLFGNMSMKKPGSSSEVPKKR
jgi:methyl-accepting chemotaxis protein